MTQVSLSILLQGFAISFGLIVAIGAQNAFVLRQGLRREHVGLVVAVCATTDAALIAAGVLGLAEVIGDRPLIANLMALFGALFLFFYGWQAFRRATKPGLLEAGAGAQTESRRAVLAQTLAFTLLNPHVYLDTLLLVGSTGAQHPDSLRLWFILGAVGASATWFGALGFGARWLAPVFANPRAWQFLDAAIGVIMWTIALLLLNRLW